MKRPTLHLICQAHIDPVWLWPWRDGAAEVLTTVQSAVDRAAEDPDFKFTRASAETYRWIETMDPRLFAQVRRLVRQGRWEVAGGWIEQPDCNLPSTESFVRQSLYGQAWFQERLGVRARVGYNVDSFGHAAGFPQLLKRAGLDYYAFMRPQARENSAVPNLFQWESPDGSRVLTQRIPGEYSQPPQATADQIEALLRAQWRNQFSPGFEDGIFFLGIGNHGGGPTREHLARIRALRQDPSLPELRFSTLGEYFAAIERSPAFRALPTIRGGLQHHARGCYSAAGEIKLLNRRAETTLRTAEACQVCAGLGGNHAMAAAALGAAWWQVLFNQFHDILAGTCVPGTLPQIRDTFGSAAAAADAVRTTAVHRLARQVDTRGAPGSVLFAFNPLPWPRTAVVQCDTFVDPHGGAPLTHLKTAAGQALPLQWMQAEASFGPHLKPWSKLTAVVDLPPCGYRSFQVLPGVGTHHRRTGQVALNPREFTIELERRRFGIGSWKTAAGREILAAPLGLVVLDDRSDTWGHGVETFGRELGRPRLIESQVVDQGPLGIVLRQKARWRESTVWLDVTQFRGVDRVELKFRLDWRERRQMVKLELPTRLRDAQAIARTAGAVIERRSTAGEESCHDWVALEGKLDGGRTTVGLLNRGSQSWDFSGGMLRTVLIRCVPFAEHDPQPARADAPEPFADEGWQERTFALTTARGAWTQANLDRAAAEFHTPAEYMLDSAHAGSAGWENAFLQVEPGNLAVLAVKPAERGPGFIVRLQEMAGRRTRARIALPGLRRQGSLWMGPWTIATARVTSGRTGLKIEELDFHELKRGRRSRS